MTEPNPPARLAVAVSDEDHSQGPPEAPLTLVEYGDFECSHCGQAYPIVKALQQTLGANLRFVFRSFPLTRIHRHALHAAEAAEAAADQFRFWEMHDVLFEHQRALGDRHLVDYARQIGLDVERFTEALRTQAFLPRVEAAFNGGVESGVGGTPTFFINGARHEGPWPFEVLLAALEERLSAGRRSP
jgi:protein-disulfide isomerase